METCIQQALERPIAWSGNTSSRWSAGELVQVKPRLDVEYLRPFIEGAHEIIMIFGAKGEVTFVSPAVERVLGYTPEELVDTDPFEFIHPDDLTATREAFEKTASAPRQAVAVLVEFRVRHKAGNWRILESATVNLTDDPRVKGVLANSRDVTDRRQAESALRESEERYRRLVELSPEPMLVHSEGVVVYINPAGARLLGAENPEALLQRPVLAIVHPDYKEIVLDRIKQTEADGEQSPPFEQKLLRIDGEVIDVEATGIPITYLGRPATLVVIHDLTARKRADAELRLQMARAEMHLRRTQALRKIDLAICGSFDLNIVLKTLLEEVLGELAVDAAAILLLNRPWRSLEYAAGRGFASTAIRATRCKLGEGFAGRAAIERRTLSVPVLSEMASSFGREDLLTAESFVSYFAVPLIAKGQVNGILEIFHRTPLNRDLEWLDFMETLAGQAAIAIDSANLFAEGQRTADELLMAYETTLEGWSAALDLRDKETEGHTQRVTEMAVRLARKMGLSESELVHVRRGALLHDIGKMGVPDSVLLKPGKLDEAEWEIMRRHPTFAHEMLYPIRYLQPALDIPYCHHEKWDGTGYPRGLKGKEIPLAARLFAAVDVWDALRSDRPYRKGWPEERVLEHIQSLAGTHFDPQVVEMFLSLVAEQP